MIPLVLAAIISTTTPEGWTLSLAGECQLPDPVAVGLLRRVGYAEAFVHIADTANRSWFSFALANPDSIFRWGARVRIGLLLNSGDTAWSTEQSAITPEARRYGIGGSFPVACEASRFQCQHFRKGAVCTMIFASFRRLDPDSVSGVRVAIPSLRSAAPDRTEVPK